MVHVKERIKRKRKNEKAYTKLRPRLALAVLFVVVGTMMIILDLIIM